MVTECELCFTVIELNDVQPAALAQHANACFDISIQLSIASWPHDEIGDEWLVRLYENIIVLAAWSSRTIHCWDIHDAFKKCK